MKLFIVQLNTKTSSRLPKTHFSFSFLYKKVYAHCIDKKAITNYVNKAKKITI